MKSIILILSGFAWLYPTYIRLLRQPHQRDEQQSRHSEQLDLGKVFVTLLNCNKSLIEKAFLD